MTIGLAAVLPNLSNGLDGTGFLFGAGSSVEAGYPVMTDLTRTVVSALCQSDRAMLDEALHAATSKYDDTTGEPNVELLADMVMAHAIKSGEARFFALEARMRDLVTEVILAVTSPQLEHHVRFLQLLKNRTYGRAASIYIFTTNYDVLFELAAAEAGVAVENGFIGSVERFFEPSRFTTVSGVIQPNARFSEHAVLTIRLVKIHGSVSWYSHRGQFFERHPKSIADATKRVMVLPRRGKVMETLQPPYDALFRIMNQSLGKDCKYLASCGFSFGDDHINSNLIQPALISGKIKLFAFAEFETSGMSAIKALPTFSAGFASSGISAGVPKIEGSNMWKFSQFVELFA
jgi:hypothetical protein